MGPWGGNKGRNRTYDRYFRNFGLGKNFAKAFFDLEIFSESFSSRAFSGPCCSGTTGRRPQSMVSVDGQRL